MSAKKDAEMPIITVVPNTTTNDKDNYTLSYELNYGEAWVVNPLVEQEAAIIKTKFLKEVAKEDLAKLGIVTEEKIYTSFGGGICHGTDGKGTILEGGIWLIKEQAPEAPDNTYRGSTYTIKMVGTKSSGCATC